jgi:hypothetical protein
MNTDLVRLHADTDVLPFVYRDNTDNDMSMIVYLPDSPVIEGELNYQQQLVWMQIRRVIRSIIGSSVLLTPIQPVATGESNEIRLHTSNQPFFVALDGMVKTVYAYDEPIGGTKLEGGNRVTLPDYSFAGREDLVYLECWLEEVMNDEATGTADKLIHRYGMVHGFTDENNIKVTSFNELSETTRRVQLRGRIRTLSGNLDLTGVGARDSVSMTYNDTGEFFLAGDGTQSSAQNLNTVDGYVYAMPLVKVVRGGNSAEMSDIEVIATATATLQQLAATTLKDVGQFASDMQSLRDSIITNASAIQSLQSLNNDLTQRNDSLATSLAASNAKIVTLEKLTQTKRIHAFMDSNHIIKHLSALSGLDTTISPGTWWFDYKFFYLPQNFRLSIGDVYGSMNDPSTGLSIRLTNLSTNLTRSWTWAPKTDAGGTYAWGTRSHILQRQGENSIIEIPEFDSTVRAQNITVMLGITVGIVTPILRQPSTAEVELIMTPL